LLLLQQQLQCRLWGVPPQTHQQQGLILELLLLSLLLLWLLLLLPSQRVSHPRGVSQVQ
jgi:hypothetical protein